ncbi:LysR family transcriptional regulator [Pelagovum pacificum]|uniref:LysR family transcriptional regulator n=1 Tax=Pelagovum pacificum TaxID=2588711 RepID=A0A5C5GHU7_9RHOB|nr:LysR family transcriptional regulator [Pelagovum pacificum]QQA42689.1 LysR family transcriptional regulator [Pelagovum pacificum]TNY34160.1 LysR family transcriptional regulator [Pelagovum pacificum]
MALPGDLDWTLLRTFLAVGEAGSLSEAARRLGSSQPTVGRQIRTLEDQVGSELFHRQSRGLVLTEAGAALIGPARRMGDASREIALSAAGREARLAGPVRITASHAISYYHLGPILARFRVAEPDISIDLVPSDAPSNLLFREADIAVRMFRPTQLDLVTRHIGDVELSAFAAKSYVARRGLPESQRDMLDHDFVGFDRNPQIIEGFIAAGLKVDRDFFATRVDDNLANWAMTRGGCGIGFQQAKVGRADPEVVEVKLDFPLPTLPIWLTAHEAMRGTPRIRRTWDALAEGLAAVVR